MPIRSPELTERQQAVRTRIIMTIADGGFASLRDELRQPAHKDVWVPLPALTVAAALITVIVQGHQGLWELDEQIWEQNLPERVPAGRSEWRNATYALQAAGCLAGGVWLDVGRQESFWELPLWPFTIDLVEMLSSIARRELAVAGSELARRVTPLLPATADVE